MSAKRQKKLALLECRSAFSCMGRAIMIMAATVSLAAFFLWIWMRAFPDRSVIQRIEIGVVANDRSEKMETTTSYLMSMPALKALCRLQELDETEAMDLLREGKLQMVIVIPENFLDDAVHMKHTELSVRIPQGGTAETDRILSLLEGVERVMLTTESAIMSMYDGMQYADINMSVSEMEYGVTDLYVNRFLNRGGYFTDEYLSPYGSFSPIQYYGVSLALLLTMMFSVCFFALYDHETVRLEKLLNPGDGASVCASVIKIVCMSLPVILFIWMLMGITHFLFWAFDMPGFYVNGYALFMGALIGVSIAALIQLFISVFGNGIRQQIAFAVFVLLMWLSGGTLGSLYYLPRLLRNTSRFNPAVIWVTGMLKSLFSRAGERSASAALLLLALSFSCGTILYVRYMKRSR